MPDIVVACSNLIEVDGRIVLVRETKSSARGRFNLPAGKLEVGETLTTGAEREAFEESGLVVRVEHLVGVYHCVETAEGFAVINFVFASTAIGGVLTTTFEHPEVRAFSDAEIRSLGDARLLRGAHIERALADHRAGVRLPVELLQVVQASPFPTTVTPD